MLTKVPKHFASGFLMGTADLVPGVSGGTIALVVGIYEHLIDSITEGSSALGCLLKWDIPRLRGHLARVDWVFLIALLVGILGAVFLLSAFLARQLEENPTILAAGFFGLVLGSVVIAWQLVKRPQGLHYLIAGLVGLALFVSLGVGESATVVSPGMAAFLGAGALAICAMILPGISGSLILVLIGMYPAVLGAVNDRDFASLGVFVLGAIVGLAVFSQFLHWALGNHHDVLLAGLIGLMAGSLRILWPWPDGVDGAVLGAPEGKWGISLAAAVIGAAVVLFISRLSGEEAD